MLPSHNHDDAINFHCRHMPQTARLVLLFSTNGNGHVLMAKLLDHVTFQPLALATAAIKGEKSGMHSKSAQYVEPRR